MNIYGYFRKYVWNDDKTPYRTQVGRLSRKQARSELFAFSVLLAAFFFVAGMVALLGAASGPGSMGVAVYSFALCCAALALAGTQHPIAALVCATAPPAALAFLAIHGFSPQLHLADKLLIGVILLALWAYTVRVIRIARVFPYLTDPAPANRP